LATSAADSSAAPVLADTGYEARCQADIALCKAGFFDALNTHRLIRLWPVILQLGQSKIFDHQTRRKASVVRGIGARTSFAEGLGIVIGDLLRNRLRCEAAGLGSQERGDAGGGGCA
jgi:hypothetical protein